MKLPSFFPSDLSKQAQFILKLTIISMVLGAVLYGVGFLLGLSPALDVAFCVGYTMLFFIVVLSLYVLRNSRPHTTATTAPAA